MTMATITMAMATDMDTDTMTIMVAAMLTWSVSLVTSATGQEKRGIITVTLNDYNVTVLCCVHV